MIRFALLLALCAFGASPSSAETRVPPGNRHAEQPDIPGGSRSRTAATRSSFEAKYEKIHALLAENRSLQDKIRKAARAYGIRPIHIAGALVGEHTYNVDAMDRLQTYYVKAAAYLTSGIDFAYRGEEVADFVARPEFQPCEKERRDARLWACREAVFDKRFRGRTVDGTTYPDDRFGAVFFQPLYAGQTFGLGQLNPLTALSVTDMVHRVSGYPVLDMRDAGEVYAAIMDPDQTLAYMAAVIRISIDAYRDIAGFDISDNPGVVATLYNVGDPFGRAEKLAAANRAGANRMPEENYYAGWSTRSSTTSRRSSPSSTDRAVVGALALVSLSAGDEADLALRLQDRPGDVRKPRDAGEPHLRLHLAPGDAVAPQVVLQEHAALDDDARPAAEQPLGAGAEIGRPGHHQPPEGEGDDGQHRARQREVVVRHPLLDEVAHDDQHHELEGRHLRELALSQKPEQEVEHREHHGGAQHDIHQGRTSTVIGRLASGASPSSTESVPDRLPRSEGLIWKSILIRISPAAGTGP